jgi:glycosyltransferase involved in cell wall biosynthesis
VVKVVYVSLSYLPTVAGGVQVLTHSIAKEMQSRGHEAQVVCAESVEEGEDDRVRSEQTVYDGLPVERLRFNRHRMPQYFRSFYDVPQVADHIVELFSKQKPDVFHVTHFSRLSGSVFYGIRKLGVPVMLTLADYTFLCPLGTLLRYNGTICAGAHVAGGVKCFGCFVDETRTYKNSFVRHVVSPDQVSALLNFVGRVPAFRRWVPPFYRESPQIFQDRIEYFRRLQSLIDLFTTNNHWSLKFYAEQGFPVDRMRCVVQSLDVSWARDFVRTPYTGPLRIGFTGSVADHKGVDVLVRAYRRMKRRKDARLLIFGDLASPLFFEELKSLCDGIEGVEFRGKYLPNDLSRIYNEMDVMVVPSMFYETGPLVILEAQATQTPVVASDLGPIRELVRHGEDGYLFERGNDGALAALLDRLCEQREDIERLRSHIRPVKTIAAMVDELEALYGELIHRRAA